MAVTGRELWYVAVLAGGQRFYIYSVPRSDFYINELIEKEREFWQLVQSGTPPEFDGSEASARILDRMYPEGEGEIELPADAFGLVAQYEDAAEREKGRQAGKR